VRGHIEVAFRHATLGNVSHQASPQQSAIRVFPGRAQVHRVCLADLPKVKSKKKIDETVEMAYPQKLARDIIVGIADPINEHFVKLIAFQFDPQLRHHFRTELRSGLNKIQRIRLKPNARTGAFKFYFSLCSITRSAASKYITRVR
jgi:hypothetical protein